MKSSHERDPLLGQCLAGNYDILEVLSVGGMGRVYRARQRALDRIVAVKVVDPVLVPSLGTSELATRFLIEARAASRLNHPNVVAIYDFGQASTTAGAPLFLVMEHLTGPTLATLLEADKLLALDRVVTIVQQTLDALGEAHAHGITHRDVKPSNIVVEQRGRSDWVKVIDFGVARIATERRVTQQGRVMGTPHYMAPELIQQGVSDPSIDLYAVGIILFELLTGRVPFDASSSHEVLRLQATAPRPDPREMHPDRAIPAALATVCMRAIAIDPAARYADTRALAAAVVEAGAQASSTPPRSTARGRRSVAPSHGPTMPVETNESIARVRAAARASSPSLREMPLVGREEAMADVRDVLSRASEGALLVFHGRVGTGRTRMLSETAVTAGALGGLVVDLPREPVPAYEVGFTCLRALVRQLAGDAVDRALTAPRAVEASVGLGLRRVLGDVADTGPSRADLGARASLVDALKWAACAAVARARGLPVVVLIDDFDAVDGISRAVVANTLESGGIAGVVFVLTCEEPSAALAAAPRACVRELLALTREQVKGLLGGGRESNPDLRTEDRPSDVSASRRRLEPLYLEHFLRWRAIAGRERPPPTLREIVDARAGRLGGGDVRALQAVSVHGRTRLGELVTLLPDVDVDAALARLSVEGFVRAEDGSAWLTHALYADVALQSAPIGIVRDLHAAAAAGIADPGQIERRAYHALHGQTGDATSMLDGAARMRRARGDVDGTIAALSAAHSLARARTVRGEGDALSTGWVPCSCKLANALAEAARAEHADGLLRELLAALGQATSGRADTLETLARVATMRGRHAEAARWLREAETAVDEEHSTKRPSTPRVRDEATTGTRRRPAIEATEPRSSHRRPTPGVGGIVPREDDEVPSSRSGAGRPGRR